MLVVMAILVIWLPIWSYLWGKSQDEILKRNVADHFTSILRGAGKYLALNHSTLLGVSSQTNGPVITLAMMRNAGCLSDQVSDTNGWNQSYYFTTRVTPEGDLTGILLTIGGREHSADEASFANVMVPETAALARIGSVPTGLLNATNLLRGPYGSWEVNLQDMGLAGVTTPGHLGMLTAMDSASLKQDFLYRVAVPGHPELNAMQIELDMTDHAIRGVKEIQYAAHDYDSMSNFCLTADDEGRTFLDAEKGLYVCRDGRTHIVSDSGNSLPIQEATLAVNFDMITKPICPAGTDTHPEIFVVPSIVATTTHPDIKAMPMHSLQAWAVDHNTDEWQVFLRVLNSEEEWIYPPDDYARMMVMTSCARD
jgi:hypothetical protein